jgi:AdoMet-dependent heme synthase
VYRTSPLFQRLRNSDELGGKCGDCSYRNLCGGSRSRAFAATGDPMAEDPRCVYQPLPVLQPNAPVGARA